MVFSALFPIFAVIALGFALSRTLLPRADAWEQMERLVYYMFFPALLVTRLAASEPRPGELASIALVIAPALAAMSALVVPLRRFVGAGALTSVYQGSIRFNTYIALAVADALPGGRAPALAALCLAVYVPLVNALSVTALSLDGGSREWRAVAGAVIGNPLVLACLAGIGLAATGLALPGPAADLLGILALPALPLGLLAVGAGIRTEGLGGQRRPLLAALFNKLALFPALAVGACLLFRVDAGLAMVLLLLTCLPAPPSAYILARQLGGDAGLMANIVTVQTLAALVTVPLWIALGGRWL